MKKEEWKDIDGFNGYQVSNLGNIRSLLKSGKYKGRILKPRQHKRRTVVVLKKENKRIPVDVARLVGRAFIPYEKDNLQIEHIDGNIFNNAVDNLKWSSLTMKEYMGKTMSEINCKGLNEYRVIGNTVYVKLRNADTEMMCDIDDWERLKKYTWFDVNGYSMSARSKKFHRMVTNPPKGYIVDHINRNTYDNRKINLRVTTPLVNSLNQSMSKDNKTGAIGVSETKEHKFLARLKLHNKTIRLGVYDTLEEAIEARKEGEEKYFKPIIENETLRM